MDFIRRDSKVTFMVFTLVGKRLRTKRAWNVGTWKVVLKKWSAHFISVCHFKVFSLVSLFCCFQLLMPPFLWDLPSLFGLIAIPIATSSKSLFPNREFQEELRYSTAKLRDASPSRKINTTTLYPVKCKRQELLKAVKKYPWLLREG